MLRGVVGVHAVLSRILTIFLQLRSMGLELLQPTLKLKLKQFLALCVQFVVPQAGEGRICANLYKRCEHLNRALLLKICAPIKTVMAPSAGNRAFKGTSRCAILPGAWDGSRVRSSACSMPWVTRTWVGVMGWHCGTEWQPSWWTRHATSVALRRLGSKRPMNFYRVLGEATHGNDGIFPHEACAPGDSHNGNHYDALVCIIYHLHR